MTQFRHVLTRNTRSEVPFHNIISEGICVITGDVKPNHLAKGEKIEDIPKEVLMDCAHLVKANSIQGCKMNNVNVVYTPWSNLKKTADMDVGQIGFHRQKDVKIVTVEKKVNEILNRLEKTKMERFPDLAAEKECRDREERNEKKAQIQEMKRREKEEMKKKREMDELRSYSSLMKVENMSSNQACKSVFDSLML
ncbi:coiled-coil domain-containing protein 25 isoform X4 [Dasypus novemcinctus]|uniref:coiled-coil domain-containing protein 25 isoform X4 n=1 Tax=Dasypus novemcinctus TaxID=9361 RepID=UPI0039C8EADC